MSKKHYIITALTLGAIAACSAALIGLTNLVTKNQILKNEQNKINAGIADIFGSSATVLEEFEVKDHKYVNYCYKVTDEDQNKDIALRTTGSNMYGKISLLAGFTYNVLPGGERQGEYKFVGLSLITNEQTYASTLVENYVTPLNNDDISLDDVSCGATYGAKLIRDMVNEATLYANEEYNG